MSMSKDQKSSTCIDDEKKSSTCIEGDSNKLHDGLDCPIDTFYIETQKWGVDVTAQVRVHAGHETTRQSLGERFFLINTENSAIIDVENSMFWPYSIGLRKIELRFAPRDRETGEMYVIPVISYKVGTLERLIELKMSRFFIQDDGVDCTMIWQIPSEVFPEAQKLPPHIIKDEVDIDSSDEEGVDNVIYEDPAKDFVKMEIDGDEGYDSLGAPVASASEFVEAIHKGEVPGVFTKTKAPERLPKPGFKLHVKMISSEGSTIQFILDGLRGQDKVWRIKELVSNAEGIPCADFKIIFAGKQLDGDQNKTLDECGIHKDVTIHVLALQKKGDLRPIVTRSQLEGSVRVGTIGEDVKILDDGTALVKKGSLVHELLSGSAACSVDNNTIGSLLMKKIGSDAIKVYNHWIWDASKSAGDFNSLYHGVIAHKINSGEIKVLPFVDGSHIKFPLMTEDGKFYYFAKENKNFILLVKADVKKHETMMAEHGVGSGAIQETAQERFNALYSKGVPKESLMDHMVASNHHLDVTPDHPTSRLVENPKSKWIRPRVPKIKEAPLATQLRAKMRVGEVLIKAPANQVRRVEDDSVTFTDGSYLAVPADDYSVSFDDEFLVIKKKGGLSTADQLNQDIATGTLTTIAWPEKSEDPKRLAIRLNLPPHKGEMNPVYQFEDGSVFTLPVTDLGYTATWWSSEGDVLLQKLCKTCDRMNPVDTTAGSTDKCHDCIAKTQEPKTLKPVYLGCASVDLQEKPVSVEQLEKEITFIGGKKEVPEVDYSKYNTSARDIRIYDEDRDHLCESEGGENCRVCCPPVTILDACKKANLWDEKGNLKPLVDCDKCKGMPQFIENPTKNYQSWTKCPDCKRSILVEELEHGPRVRKEHSSWIPMGQVADGETPMSKEDLSSERKVVKCKTNDETGTHVDGYMGSYEDRLKIKNERQRQYLERKAELARIKTKARQILLTWLEIVRERGIPSRVVSGELKNEWLSVEIFLGPNHASQSGFIINGKHIVIQVTDVEDVHTDSAECKCDVCYKKPIRYSNEELREVGKSVKLGEIDEDVKKRLREAGIKSAPAETYYVDLPEGELERMAMEGKKTWKIDGKLKKVLESNGRFIDEVIDQMDFNADENGVRPPSSDGMSRPSRKSSCPEPISVPPGFFVCPLHRQPVPLSHICSLDLLEKEDDDLVSTDDKEPPPLAESDTSSEDDSSAHSTDDEEDDEKEQLEKKKSDKGKQEEGIPKFIKDALNTKVYIAKTFNVDNPGKIELGRPPDCLTDPEGWTKIDGIDKNPYEKCKPSEPHLTLSEVFRMASGVRLKPTEEERLLKSMEEATRFETNNLTGIRGHYDFFEGKLKAVYSRASEIRRRLTKIIFDLKSAKDDKSRAMIQCEYNDLSMELERLVGQVETIPRPSPKPMVYKENKVVWKGTEYRALVEAIKLIDSVEPKDMDDGLGLSIKFYRHISDAKTIAIGSKLFRDLVNKSLKRAQVRLMDSDLTSEIKVRTFAAIKQKALL